MFIWYNYPKGGVMFRIGNDITLYNIKFACGFMTKKRFIGILTFLPPRNLDMLESLEPHEE